MEGKQFLRVLKLQTKARVLAFEPRLLMANLAFRWRLVFDGERRVNAQTPSTPVGPNTKTKCDE